MQWAKCLELMLAGDYDQGFPAHEDIRSGNPRSQDVVEATETFDKQVWRGEKVEALLINADFGMGDTIHFYRYLKLARKLADVIYLRCDGDFKTLFGDEVVAKEEPIPLFPTHVSPQMALPRALGLGTKDIAGGAYLKVNNELLIRRNERIAVWSAMGHSFKFGVCLQGNPFNPRDAERSLPKQFRAVLPGLLSEEIGNQVRPFWLCKHEAPPNAQYLDVRPLLNDWNGTADVIQSLHLVISVDTAVAHLAGALGVPCWLLLPESPDWRWGREGKRTPWYDSVRIFRQEQFGWPALLGEVIEEFGKHHGRANQ